MRGKGKILITLGLLLITAALFLTIYNIYEDHDAQDHVYDATEQLAERIPQNISGENSDLPESTPSALPEQEIADYILNPAMDMPTETIDGVEYIGILRIPDLELELPIVSEWNKANLKIAPCRYTGSVYQDNMVIAGHNYRSHFRRLIKNLQVGAEVTFTDVDGNVFRYRMAEREILGAYDSEEMRNADDWDLTLFTCTIGGRSRVVVRCVKAE